MRVIDPTPSNQGSNADGILFFDDFSSGELDRTKWNVVTTGKVYNRELQAYIDDKRTISCAAAGEVAGSTSGALVFTAHYEPGFTTADGQTFDFVSGRINTRQKFSFRFGTASARMKLPAGTGLWPAFWTLGEGRWPQCGEIDVMESIGDPAWVSAAAHGPGYFRDSALVNRYYFDAQHSATSWHVYSLHWKPDELTFQVDGSIIYRVTRPMVDFLGRWVFDDEMYLLLNFAIGGTYPFKTHGIAQPYYGLHQDALETIQGGQAKVYVDWVRVRGLSSD